MAHTCSHVWVGICSMVFHDVVKENFYIFNYRMCAQVSRAFPVTKHSMVLSRLEGWTEQSCTLCPIV